MKVGISSAVFYPLESEKSFDKLISAGFSTAEFFYNCEYEISDEFIEYLSEKIKNGGMEIISVHPFTAFAEGVFFFSDYKRRTEEQLKKYENTFKQMQKLGARYFTLHGDRAFKGISDDFCKLTERNAETLRTLSRIAKKYGVTVCLENVSWCKSANISYVKAVYDAVPEIGFTLDLKQARRAGVSVYEYIEAMGNRIKNIHVSDFDDTSDCLPPGEGKFDFGEFLAKIKDMGYTGDVLIEVYSSNFTDEEQLVKARRFLEAKITDL